jgi:sulfocyanin
MYMHLSLRTTRGLVGSCALAAALLVGSGIAQAKTPTWVTTKGKVVSLTLIAGYNGNGGGFNFNGAAKGQLTVTVPLGDTVKVTFSNNSQLPHSAQIIAFSKSAPVSAVSDAFKNAHSANPTNGVAKGTTQKFSFVTNKAGKYLIICAVPGHAAAGMWDTLVVTKSAKTATAAIKM